MKERFLFLFLLFPFFLSAQLPKPDSSTVLSKPDSAILRTDSTGIKKDSVLLLKDSLQKIAADKAGQYNLLIRTALQHSRYINTTGTPLAKSSKEMPALFDDILFYLLLAILLFFAFLRFLFERYFNNMFRVFFNTSLRQSQLTDQLLQARQVSLFYNILFLLVGGVYTYFLLAHFKWINSKNALVSIGICTVCLALIYFFKYASLKFTGWITGFRAAASTYTFIIFLINKILGVLLIPFVIVIGFGKDFLQYPAILVSLLFIGLMFLLRFLRSYGLLRKDIKVSRFHFFIYILGVEILPLLLIYKGLVVLFDKNL